MKFLHQRGLCVDQRAHFTYSALHIISLSAASSSRAVQKVKESAFEQEKHFLCYTTILSFLSLLHTLVSPLAVPHWPTAIDTLAGNSAITAD